MEMGELDDHWTGLSPRSSGAKERAVEELAAAKRAVLKGYRDRRENEAPGDLRGPCMDRGYPAQDY
jgi:hypothetical protein